MIMIIEALLLVVVICYLYFIYQPVLVALKLKLKYGKAVKILWRPHVSEFIRIQKNKKKYSDTLEEYYQIITKNPDVKIMVSNILSNAFILVTDPEYAKEIYINHQYYDKFNIFGTTELVHQGLAFISSGPKWRQQRQILGDSFTFEKLKARIPMINETVKESFELKETTTPVLDLIVFIAGEIVYKSFFGETAKNMIISGQDAKSEVVAILNDLGIIIKTSPFFLLKSGFLGQKAWDIMVTDKEKKLKERIQNMKSFSKGVIEERIKNPTNSNDFLSVYTAEYIKGEKDITIEEMIQQFITLFFAGTDTTAITTYFCLYFLAKYPQFQQEIFEEISQVTGNEGVTSENINKLERTSAFINEVFRLKNPAYAPIQRKVLQTHSVKDLQLQKGWYVCVMQNIIQHSSKYFDDPLTFNYHRFYKQNPIKNDNGFVHVPFSAGGRNCIGQHMALIEMKIILAQILKKYEVQLNPGVDIVWDVQFLYCLEAHDAVKLVKRI